MADSAAPGTGRLTPIGWAIGGMLALALAVAGGVIAILFAVGQFRGFQKEPLTAASLYDLVKIGFAFAAGVGGVVALVTAYRRQRVAEFAHALAARIEERAIRAGQQEQELAGRAEEREAARLFNERFAAAAGQLGDDRPAVRLAGVYAMAGLADDWAQQRQTCVNVLCAYLRMPYDPQPRPDAPDADRHAFRAVREVRHTVMRVIADHLQPDDRRPVSAQDWRGLDLDLTGAVFDGGNFAGATFSGGTIDFAGATFSGGTVDFRNATFSGGTVDFTGAAFSGGTVDFTGAAFSGGTVDFRNAAFSGGTVDFTGAAFSGGTVDFTGARFSDGLIHFISAGFSGGTVDFRGAAFSGGTVDFGDAVFSGCTVDFREATFSGGTVDFRRVRDWSMAPSFLAGNAPSPGVLLPPGAGG